MTRTFVVVGHEARTDADWTPKDLPGSAGRLDVLVRAATRALLLSHGIREETEVYLVLEGPPDPPKTVRLRGADLEHVNPDERSTALLVGKALEMHLAGPVWRESTPGLEVSGRGLADLQDELAGRPVRLLEEGGEDGADHPWPADPVVVLGDHRDLTDEERAVVEGWGAEAVGLGPASYHADHCVAVVQWLLDRRG